MNKRRNLLKGEEQQAELNKIILEFLSADPAIANPSYYCYQYNPIFHAIDNLEEKQLSSASMVMDVMQSLGLTQVIKFHNTDFRTFINNTDNQWLPFDFIWNDANGFDGIPFKELFDLLNPNSGIMVVHDMLTSEIGQKEISNIKQAQATTMFNDFEFFSILEPHKFFQTSAILIRKTSCKPKLCPNGITPEVEQDFKRFLETRANLRLDDV